jgi:lysophospholipase L1-like esterase
MIGFAIGAMPSVPRPGLPWRALSAGTSVPTGIQQIDPQTTLVRVRTRHAVMASTRRIKAIFALFYVNDQGVETTLSLPAGTTLAVSFELVPAQGSPARSLSPGTFKGDAAIASPTGDVAETDELDVATAFGGSIDRIVPGDVLWIKQEWRFPPGGAVLPITDSSGGSTGVSGEGCYYGGVGSVDSSGSLAAQGGSARTTRLLRPFLLLGRHREAAIAGIGDSITFGKGAANPAGDGSNGTNGGWFAMAAYAAQRAHTKLAKPGDRATNWTGAGADRRVAAAAFHSHALIALGTNDLADAGDQSENLLAAHAVLRARLKATNPLLTVHAAQVPLRVSASSDAYSTLAGQQPTQGYANDDAERRVANDGLRSAVGTDLDGVFDLNPAMADAERTDRWKVNGTANWSTSDGTHPSQVRAADMAALVRPILDAMQN